VKGNKMLKHFALFGDLIKYKLSFAVVLSAVTGYFIYDNIININLLYLSAGVFFLASGSAVLNQYSERITDSMMKRTINRPIPSKRISEKGALSISVVLIFTGSIALLLNGITPLLLGLSNVLIYNLIYTRLKKITVFSILPGGVVGAIPPLIGYSSGGGDILNLNLNIILFSSFMFLWQLPHFWLIIIKYGKEYSNAGLATISTYLNESQIKNLVFYWVLVSNGLLLISFLITDLFSKEIFILLSIINIIFILLFYRLLFLEKEKKELKGAFILINSFSIFIMILLIMISAIRNI